MFHVSSSCPCNLKVALCPSPRRRFLESESQRRSLSQKRFIMPGAIGCNVVNPRITYNHHSTHMGMVYNVPKFCMSHWVQRLILGVSTDQIWHWPYRVPTKQWPKFLSWLGQEYRQSGVFKKWINVVKNKHAQYYNILYTTTNSQVFLGIKWIWSCSFVLQNKHTWNLGWCKSHQLATWSIFIVVLHWPKIFQLPQTSLTWSSMACSMWEQTGSNRSGKPQQRELNM